MNELSLPLARALGELRGWLLAPGRLERLELARTPGYDADDERAFLATIFDQLAHPATTAAATASLDYLARARRCYDAARKVEHDPDAFAWLLDDLLKALGWACDAQDVAEGRMDPGAFALQQRADGTFGAFLSDATGGAVRDAWHPRPFGGPGPRAAAFRWHRWAKTICERDYLSRAAKQLAPLLAMYADAGTGECYPTQAQLARLSGMTTRAIRDALKELERDLAIVVKRPPTGRAPALYALLSSETAAPRPVEIPF